ncbi:ankyrin repeat-containing protein NPR4-like isoform X2 [Lycium ferocissimum]|uniref:ankyrin repeat-containing protein NPR4-like isoform X2 n=1 Tax=Lycium ferocissimum TaxID=112874 RepID=UPI0028166696|nr:ankyrin repeat-containing protein NPR4-like isoform X2 [Lycium ferocissimum]
MSKKITGAADSGLHVLVGAGKWFDDLMRDPTMISPLLTLRNRDGHTPLCVAATVGNMQAARKLLPLEMGLPPTLRALNEAVGPYPIIEAARYGHKEMVLLLIWDMGRKMCGSPPTKESAASLFLHLLVEAGFYDLLLALVQRHLGLGRAEFYGDNNESLLSLMAAKPSAFRSGTQLSFWQQLLYSARPIRQIRETKLMHEAALKIVKCLCEELMKHYFAEDMEPVLRTALLSAASSGTSAIIEEIIERYPDAIWFADSEHHNLFHLAVINRYEKVFNLIYQLSAYKYLVTANEDTSGNNILHMAGKLAPLGRLNLISGAALQMQRELQWFQEVEKFVHPTFRSKRNSNGKTPNMVFTEEHKELVKKRQKWMKETANSCIFVAALTATVGFAAAITVPGGNNQNSGFPLFSNEKAFTVFAVSVAFCQFSSVASVLMFLSILTSRYAEEDFLKRLPKRLILGLSALFVSMTSLMIAFGATIYLIFGQKKRWILIPVGIAALIPVNLFESLQSPLLWDMFMSTYGPSIFRKQGSRVLY